MKKPDYENKAILSSVQPNYSVRLHITEDGIHQILKWTEDNGWQLETITPEEFNNYRRKVLKMKNRK